MTQNKARKAAVRARMAETSEPYTAAARHLDNQGKPYDLQAIHGAISEKFDLPDDALTLVLRHLEDADEYPLLGAAASGRPRVYLDLKDWVALAKARLGRPEFPHDQAAYQALREATARGQVIVPLTSTTYQEVSRIVSLRQRTDLANVMAEISGFVTITGRSIILRHQVQTALAARFSGPEPAPIRPLGIGISFSAGDQRRLILRTQDGTGLTLPADQVHDIETTGRALMEYLMMRGPAPEEIPQLRALGYEPDAVIKIEEERLDREKQLAAMLRDGTTSRDRLGDIVHARHLFWELRDHLRKGLTQYGVDINDFFANGKEWLTAFLDDIPSAAITITLTEKTFRNPDKAWKGNDLRDADAMSAAIPYCDIVLTDKYAAAQLAKSPTAAKQGTLVLARLRDLNDKLPQLIASRPKTPDDAKVRTAHSAVQTSPSAE